MNNAEASAWFQGYAAAFGAFDAGAIADHLHVPCTVLGKGYVVALASREQALQNFEGMNRQHQAQGFHRAELEACAVDSIHEDDMLEARTIWAFRTADGSLISRFRLRYFLSRQSGSWKIAVAVNLDA